MHTYAAIVIPIKEKFVNIMERLEDPVDQCNKLTEKLDTIDMSLQLMVLKQLRTMKMKEDKFVEEYINNAKDLSNQFSENELRSS